MSNSLSTRAFAQPGAILRSTRSLPGTSSGFCKSSDIPTSLPLIGHRPLLPTSPNASLYTHVPTSLHAPAAIFSAETCRYPISPPLQHTSYLELSHRLRQASAGLANARASVCLCGQTLLILSHQLGQHQTWHLLFAAFFCPCNSLSRSPTPSWILRTNPGIGPGSSSSHRNPTCPSLMAVDSGFSMFHGAIICFPPSTPVWSCLCPRRKLQTSCARLPTAWQHDHPPSTGRGRSR